MEKSGKLTHSIPGSPIMIIGHRGAMGHAPENTRASFETGLRCGADAVECDVQLSKDGQLVVIHDTTLDRTTHGHGAVAKTTWAVLRLLDAGSWYGRAFAGERLWRLSDLLAWAKPLLTKAQKPLHLIVEMKPQRGSSSPIAAGTVRAIQKAGMVRRTVVISFDHAAAARAKSLCPGLRVGLLLNQIPRDLARRMLKSRANAIFPRYTLVTDTLMKLARQKGWSVGTWTVNKRSDMKRLVNLGVDAIATNFPERMRSFQKL